MNVLKRPPESVLFDLDGTLVDTAGEFVAIVQAMRSERDLQPLDEHLIRRVVSNGANALVSLAFDSEVDTPLHEALRDEFLNRYAAQLGQSAQPYPALRELVGDIARAGIPWGVVTNKLRRFAEPLMASLNFLPEANVLVTPCDVTAAKPDPEAILHACSRVSARPEGSLYIGDHARDIEAGRRAGCITIAASYGYLTGIDDPESWGADLIVDSSQELATLIRQAMA